MLKIRLHNEEKMVVNGAVLRAAGPTTLWLENDAAILRGREVMRPEEADTPARRLYFACMMAYLDPGNRDRYQQDIVTLLGEFLGAIETVSAKAVCAAMAREAACGHYYRALAHCRDLIVHETALLHGPLPRSKPSSTPGTAEMTSMAATGRLRREDAL